MKKFLALLLSFAFVFSFGCTSDGKPSGTNPDVNPKPIEVDYGNVENVKNIILLIGDGMGTEQIKAGNLFYEDGLYLDGMPNKILTETGSLDTDKTEIATDSGAAGTALATGVRTNNGLIGLSPEREQLTTIVDIAKGLGKSTGIITTEKLCGATPMTFSAHGNRDDYQDLVNSAALTGNVDLFIGEDDAADTVNYNIFTTLAGYTAINNVDDISETSLSDKILGVYPISADAESMSEYSFDRLVFESLEYLSKNENGFFLMAEGAHIDHGGHSNSIERMLDELLAFDLGVKVALEWAKNRNDTIVMVTADHETGGFMLGDKATKDNLFDEDEYGTYLNYRWSTKTHTGADVWLYLYGMKMDFTKYSTSAKEGKIKNNDIFTIMNSFFTSVQS